MTERILIAYDDKKVVNHLKNLLIQKTSHQVTITTNPLEVASFLKARTSDVVITGLKMPGKTGLELLEEIKGIDENIPVIIITAYGTIESAVETIRKGAYDYITRPFKDEQILITLNKAINWLRVRRENIYLKKALDEKVRFHNIIGSSTIMQEVYRRIERVAKTSATILITGESGTGKELVARAIHADSLRSNKGFIAVSCSAIPESLIESELFGHLKGSFTGALRDRKGLIEEANYGTLFLDEIGDLSLMMQTKLLRLLQEGEFKVVGDARTKKADVRIIAATNKDLAQGVNKKEFREDLYYRLNVIHIILPPLRDRRDDIPVLAHYFLKKYARMNNKQLKGMSSRAMDVLLDRDWPGNIRELENVIERGVVLSSGDILNIDDLSLSKVPKPVEDLQGGPPADLFSLSFKEAKEKLISNFHARYIKDVLSKYGGNVSKAAKACGLKRQYLHRLMREAHIRSASYKKD